MTKIINIKIDEQEPRVVKQTTVEDYRKLLLLYKFKNPVKFEAKIPELKAKFSALGGKWSDIESGILDNKRAEVNKLERELKLVKDGEATVKVEEPKEEPKKAKK